MSLAFDAIDDVVSGGGQTLGNLVTYFMWIKPGSAGRFGRGHYICHGAVNGDTGGVSVSARLCLFFDDTLAPTGAFNLFAGWSTVGRWRSPGAQWIAGQWQSIAATYDYGSAANVPALYYNGLPVAVTALWNPSGSPLADNLTLYIGRNHNDRTVDGPMAEVTVWKRVLSAAEIAAVHTAGINVCPDHFDYLPFDSGRIQNLGSSATVFTISGALAAENPPIRPAGRRG